MNEPLRATVVIPAYRRPERLVAAVESALSQDLPAGTFEVIVVDSSPDDTNARLVESLRSRPGVVLRCLRKSPEGPGPSRNLGAANSTSPVLAFLDSDCVADPAWLRRGLEAFAEGIGLVQGRTIPEPGVPLGALSFYIEVSRESPLYETCNMFYRREALKDSGGFPEDLEPLAETPMGSEDVLVAWRARRAGWRTAFAADAVVAHEVRRLGLPGWIIIRRMYIYPWIVRHVPEFRRFLYLHWFLDRFQAALCLGLAGVVVTPWQPWAWLAMLPYVVLRATEPTRSLRGPLRVVRAAAYLLRDLATMGLLLAGSVRARRLVL